MARLAVVVAAAFSLIGLASAGVMFPQPITGTEGCGRCDRTKCTEPQNCPAGLTWDRCLCCRICARREGDRCDLGAPLFDDTKHDSHHTWVEAVTKFSANYLHGACGEKLDCKLRTDMDEEEMMEPSSEHMHRPETTCVCRDQNPRCGNDNQTYSTLCALVEESNMGFDSDGKPKPPVTIMHAGPCRKAPKIIQPLENHISLAYGANAMFTCDVSGYPLPQISWHLYTVDGQTRNLPDGDGRISVSSRGASQPDRVTSWLQIIQVAREHEGDYICTVENGIGDEIKSTGRLLVKKNQHEIENDDKHYEIKAYIGKKFGKKRPAHLLNRERRMADDDNEENANEEEADEELPVDLNDAEVPQITLEADEVRGEEKDEDASRDADEAHEESNADSGEALVDEDGNHMEDDNDEF